MSIKDSRGFTPLHFAVSQGFDEAVNLLTLKEEICPDINLDDP